MSILINAHNISKSFGARPLFSNISFSVAMGSRIGLIGPNGMGKSTLLKILAQQETSDSGTLSFQKGLKVGLLAQVPSFNEDSTVLATVLEHSADAHDWENIGHAQKIISKLDLSHLEEAKIETLSGGQKKRIALARELASNPDLLLLDEPTNHLDIEGIFWLEDFIANQKIATITITHDRSFLNKVSNKIFELDRTNKNGLLIVDGNYARYLQTKSEVLNAQVQQEAKLQNTLRQELEWLSRGPQARTTKQQARIDRAYDLEKEVQELEYRNKKQEVRLDFAETGKAPKKLIEAKSIGAKFGERQLFNNFNLIVGPSSRIALLGPNGCGKSTLIKILTASIKPHTGEMFFSPDLKISYFEQHREDLNLDDTILRSLDSREDHVVYQGKSIHIRSYLDRFLFRPEQLEMPIRNLSGGEQSRLLIAKMMLTTANVLVLDEPTNDLDFATLDVLAQVLDEFKGAVILVTHDRFFMDQVAKQIFAFGFKKDGAPTIESFSELSQWQTWPGRFKPLAQLTDSKSNISAGPATKKKLSFKDQHDLKTIEGRIAEAESILAKINLELVQNASNSQRLLELSKDLQAAQKNVDDLYKRWGELEALFSEIKAQ